MYISRPLSAQAFGRVPTSDAAFEQAETAAAAVQLSKGAPSSASLSRARRASWGLPHRPRAEIRLLPASVSWSSGTCGGGSASKARPRVTELRCEKLMALRTKGWSLLSLFVIFLGLRGGREGGGGGGGFEEVDGSAAAAAAEQKRWEPPSSKQRGCRRQLLELRFQLSVRMEQHKVAS